MGRNTGRGKVAYSWISPDPAEAGPTLGVVVVVVVFLGSTKTVIVTCPIMRVKLMTYQNC